MEIQEKELGEKKKGKRDLEEHQRLLENQILLEISANEKLKSCMREKIQEVDRKKEELLELGRKRKFIISKVKDLILSLEA